MVNRAIPLLHMTSADSTEAFYCERLGFHLEFEVRAGETQRDPCYLGVARDGAVLHLSSHAEDSVVGGVVNFECDEVDSLHAEFEAKGVAIHVGPVDQTWGLREMYVLDPDGNSLRFGAEIED